MLVFKVIEWLTDELVVEKQSAQFQMEFAIRKFSEDFFMHVGSGHSVARNLLQSQVDEIALFAMDDVVVADELPPSLASGQLVEIVIYPLGESIDGDPYFALLDEIHFSDFLIFLVYDLVHGVGGVKSSWKEPECEFAEEPLVCPQVPREESVVLAENVRKQVVAHDPVNDGLGQDGELLVLQQEVGSVLTPEVLLVLGDVVHEAHPQWLARVESFKRNEPDVQARHLVGVAHFLVVIGDNFDEVAHDEREESYSTKHDDDG
jgi:hypothetical protein